MVTSFSLVFNEKEVTRRVGVEGWAEEGRGALSGKSEALFDGPGRSHSIRHAARPVGGQGEDLHFGAA